MTSSLRERRRQMLRDEILSAARALLAEKGYATMSMEELAARVGVSKPTLYSHFTTKDDLVIAAATSVLERVLDVIEAGLEGNTPLHQLTLLLHTIIRMQVESGALAVQMPPSEMFQLLRRSHEACSLIQQIDDAVIDLVRAAIEQYEIAPEFDVATVVRTFHALAKAPFSAPFSKSGPLNPETVADMLATIFQRGVQAQHAHGALATGGLSREV